MGFLKPQSQAKALTNTTIADRSTSPTRLQLLHLHTPLRLTLNKWQSMRRSVLLGPTTNVLRASVAHPKWTIFVHASHDLLRLLRRRQQNRKVLCVNQRRIDSTVSLSGLLVIAIEVGHGRPAGEDEDEGVLRLRESPFLDEVDALCGERSKDGIIFGEERGVKWASGEGCEEVVEYGEDHCEEGGNKVLWLTGWDGVAQEGSPGLQRG